MEIPDLSQTSKRYRVSYIPTAPDDAAVVHVENTTEPAFNPQFNMLTFSVDRKEVTVFGVKHVLIKEL